MFIMRNRANCDPVSEFLSSPEITQSDVPIVSVKQL